jgi:hypothetical protein
MAVVCAPPSTLEANCAYRIEVARQAAADEAYRWEVIARCKADIFFWIDTFVIQFNSKRDSGNDKAYGPFICRAVQRKAIQKILDCIDAGKDLVIEKSRQEGGSWVIILVFVWLFLYRPGVALLMVSRKQDMVDSHLPMSLFWKVRLILKWLPTWLLPVGWDWKKDHIRNYFENRELGSYLFGEATTEDIAVGGTLTAIALDEFSRVEKDHQVRESTAQASACRIFNSTHLGTDTAFYALTQQDRIEKLVMHWTDNPIRCRGLYEVRDGRAVILDKTYNFGDYRFVLEAKPSGGPKPCIRSPWYDRECERIGSDRGVAQNLDINPAGSVAQFFNAITIRLLKERCTAGQYGKDFWQGTIKLDLNGNIVQWIPGDGPIRYWGHWDSQGKPRVNAGEEYGAGVDVSEGVGVTPSCLSVIHETGEKVLAVATADMKPWEFATFCVAICRHFNRATLCWETPGPGYTFGDRVIEMGYMRVHWSANEDEVFARRNTKKPGWQNDGKKHLLRLLLDYQEALENGRFLNHCWFALDETLQFRYKREYPEHAEYDSLDKDPSGAKINHGDRVIGDALGWKMVKARAKALLAAKDRPSRFDLRTSEGRIQAAIRRSREDQW